MKKRKKRVKVKELKRSIQVSIDITDIFKQVLKDAVEQELYERYNEGNTKLS